ncbi:MAG: hypothetical protein U1G07_23660 [Verrucomicrobiota bacterium]
MKKSLRTIRALTAAGCIWVWTQESVCTAGVRGVNIAGSYDYTVQPDDPNPLFQRRYQFEAFISGRSWVINYEDTAAATNAALLNTRATASCDGTNIYFVQFQSQAAVREAWGERYDSVKKELPVAVAKIYPGGYPPSDEFALQRIWFAVAAGNELKAPHGQVKPAESVDLAVFYSTNFYSHYQWTNFNERATSRELVITNDGHFVFRDQGNGELRNVRRAPPYNNGFVEGVAKWSEGLFVEGLYVGKEFEFTGYAPKVGKSGTIGFKRSHLDRCTITNVSGGVIEAIPAALPPGRVLVTDRRFAGEGLAKLDYILTNGWVTADDPLLTRRAQNSPRMTLEAEAVDLLGIKPAGLGWFRYTIWVLVPLPLGIWAVKGLFGKRNNKKEKQTT